MAVMGAVKFRYNAAVSIAGIVAFLGAIPVATTNWYLLPILLVPALVAVWGWRAGTDADASGVRVRALFGSRTFPWSRITHLAPDARGRVHAALDDGRAVRLAAVGTAQLHRLVAASGRELDAPEPAHADG
jgi:hypothetical protein